MSDVTVLAVEGVQITALSVDGPDITVIESTVGAQGPRGPAGTPGGVDLSFEHAQSAAASTWVVAHGLGKRPSVTVVDSAGDQVEGDVTYIDLNNLTIDFSAPFSGEAFLN